MKFSDRVKKLAVASSLAVSLGIVASQTDFYKDFDSIASGIGKQTSLKESISVLADGLKNVAKTVSSVVVGQAYADELTRKEMMELMSKKNLDAKDIAFLNNYLSEATKNMDVWKSYASSINKFANSFDLTNPLPLKADKNYFLINVNGRNGIMINDRERPLFIPVGDTQPINMKTGQKENPLSVDWKYLNQIVEKMNIVNKQDIKNKKEERPLKDVRDNVNSVRNDANVLYNIYRNVNNVIDRAERLSNTEVKNPHDANRVINQGANIVNDATNVVEKLGGWFKDKFKNVQQNDNSNDDKPYLPPSL